MLFWRDAIALLECLKYYCFYVNIKLALIYMLSSITKKGETESTFAPLVVLVINNNIYLIVLMFPLSTFQGKFKDGMAKGLWRDPEMQGIGLAKLALPEGRKLLFVGHEMLDIRR